ncbi:4'-phosphopantetheinyl transferase family protein [Pedobacter aquatilis]|uniref:4'-phosphopantetheinyl transferase family protein n=1 Tax=Pedobacter aquatilis TaxID=351343 RepID=UPI002930BEB3|nr:4'-phosphopantetheinyl transferase superfamily protein [Pedobacter aquatilis]
MQNFVSNIIWETANWKWDLNKIHVFKINVAEKFKDISTEYNAILSDAELLKSSKYLHNNDKERYITSKYFLRLILAQFTEIAPTDLEFSFHNNKKPKLNGIEFNVSHSGNLILITISSKPIGVDIESINRAFDFESLLEICFHPEEIKYLSNNNLDTFYTFWTRKEALLKATGEGLIDNLESIDTTKKSDLRKNYNYYWKTFSLEENYIASIAYQPTEEDQFKFWQI